MMAMSLVLGGSVQSSSIPTARVTCNHFQSLAKPQLHFAPHPRAILLLLPPRLSGYPALTEYSIIACRVSNRFLANTHPKTSSRTHCAYDQAHHGMILCTPTLINDGTSAKQHVHRQLFLPFIPFSSTSLVSFLRGNGNISRHLPDRLTHAKSRTQQFTFPATDDSRGVVVKYPSKIHHVDGCFICKSLQAV
ncbi:hypothetical protein GQ44DRAFT_336699 [Phaeosphaeriaceae sp. PMI808]|nr:hypothetical protein GQ44DRAFT_336699 [Phaeosphaeriaceae sp. PMI808]